MLPSAYNRYINGLVWLVAVLVLLLIPLKIIGYGYLPLDDALRHAAKAVSGKTWSDILILNPDFSLDHNPGWHVLLGGLHSLMGWEADALVTFSVVGLFVLFVFVPLIWVKRPEAWLLTLLLVFVANQGIVNRIFLGRPLMVSVVVLMTLLLFFGPEEEAGGKRTRKYIFAGVLFALATWMHGAWYLFALPIGAVFLSGRVKESVSLAVSWLVGSVVGAIFTGHPVAFLIQAVKIVTAAFGEALPSRILVFEFQPTDGDFKVLLVFGGFALWRITRGWSAGKALRDPVFILLVIGWVLGLKVSRFWYDWGVPAGLVWMARGLSEEFAVRLPQDQIQRLVLSCLAAAGLFFATTSDLSSRWTHNLNVQHLAAKDPDLAGWLPDDGGIIYNDDMAIFYQTFFHNPHAPWKYMLGYEPTLMPAEDLAIFRRLQMLNGAYEAYTPWVMKMNPADRLIIHGGPAQKPEIPALQWGYAGSNTWIGRKPKSGTTPAPAQPR